ncbi:MAG: hypothetical protein FJ279_19400 [Planctomycetes bacterium]|nr:hypothetical protein [Planctomycetota bacterium]
MKCEESRTAVWRFIDGELDEQETTDFKAHVALCHNCRRVLRSAQKEDGFYRTSGASLALDEDTSSAVLALLPERRPAAGGPRPKAQSAVGRTPSRFPTMALAAVAVIVVGLATFALGFALGRQRVAAQKVAPAAGEVSHLLAATKVGVVSKVAGRAEWAASLAGSSQPLAQNADVLEGRALKTGDDGGIVAQLGDGVKILVNRRSTVTIQKDRTLSLQAGEVLCRVPTGKPGFAVQAGRVRAVALGATFSVSLAANGMVTLTVLEGKARLTNELDSREVAAGKAASALADKPTTSAKQVNVAEVVAWASALDKDVRVAGQTTGWISGVVRSSPDGKPLKGMTIRLAATPSGADAEAEATTDAEGLFQMDGLLPGRYLATAHGSGYGPRRLPEATVKAGEGTQIEIAAEPKTFSAFMYCRVFNASGQPLERVTVNVREYPKADPVARAQTDVDGKCELGPLAARKYHLDVTTSPDKAPSASQAVNLTPGESSSVDLVIR